VFGPTCRSLPAVAIILHRVMALGDALLVGIGLVMADQKLRLRRLFQLHRLHQSIGVAVRFTAVRGRAQAGSASRSWLALT
jgi:cytochrome b561